MPYQVSQCSGHAYVYLVIYTIKPLACVFVYHVPVLIYLALFFRTNYEFPSILFLL
jgi:hypothetical protein